ATDRGVDRAMQTRYVAYGLELLSSFPLPGMSPAGGPGLPQLTLTRDCSHELAAAWGGHEDGSLSTGAPGHGLALRVQRGHAAGVSAFRGTPHMSIYSRPLTTARGSEPGARITRSAPARTAQLRILAGTDCERWVAAPIAGRVPRPVRALCLLERGIGLALAA